MNTPVVKSALEMGFDRNLVKQTVQSKILTSGENYKTVQELVSDLLSAEDEKREEEKELFAEEMASGKSNLKLVMYQNSPWQLPSPCRQVMPCGSYLGISPGQWFWTNIKLQSR